MSDKSMYTIRDMLCKEIDEIAATGKVTSGDLSTVHLLTDTVKNIDKIMRMSEEGYSYGGEWQANGNYSRNGGSYGNYPMNSDSYGRSMNDDAYSGRHYVRGHYSNANEREMLCEKVEQMMRNSSMSAGDKETLRRTLEEIRY